MKKLLTLVVAALMIMTFAVAANAQDISVTLNGEALVFEQAPVIVEGRTLVPLRAIFEALGASVEWDDATKTVTSVKDDITVKLTIGSNVLYKNDEAVELDVPAQIVGAGYTMVPARAIAESFGVLVDWDDSTKTVILVKEEEQELVEVTVPEGTVLMVNGENYTEDMGITGINNDGMQIVDNPDNPGDQVIFVETNKEGKAWNYFWYDCEWVPGQRYIIRFKAKAANDCYGNPIATASFGINVHTNGADKGIDSYVVDGGVWRSFANVVTIPADIDTSKKMAFGIFASPVKVDGYDTELAWSFYLDDVSVIPYDGVLEDGRADTNLAWQALPFDFNIDSSRGYEVDLSTMTSTSGAYTEAGFHFNKPSKDPLAYASNLNIDADKYGAVAVKFEMTGVEVTAASRDVFQIFFGTATDAAINDTKSISVYYTSLNKLADGSYVAYFNFAGSSKTKDAWTGSVTQLRVDPGNTEAGSWLIKKIVFLEK